MTDYDLTSLESLAQHPVVKTWLAVMECMDNLDEAHVISAEIPERASSGWTVYDPTNFEDPLSTTHCFEVHRVHLQDFTARLERLSYVEWSYGEWSYASVCSQALHSPGGREAIAERFNRGQWEASHMSRIVFIREMCRFF